ncbi:response regulator [Massilia sp. LjRoot122]|uniref:response regulator n=1 Tax=Massilia sp. LjRoot122 TaxID=3342257 RepID=UPI003ECC6DA2
MTTRPDPIRVFLVDDHQTILWGLQQLVASRHPDMAVAGVASRADEALRLACLLQPDVVLLDMDLGDHDGEELIPQLQACCKANILVLTGLRDEARTDQAVLCGARGIVSKEASAELVLKAIESVHRGELWLDRLTTARVFQCQREREQRQTVQKTTLALLTPKEGEIVRKLVEHSGLNNRELAQLLFMSEHTLRNHLSSIYHKVEVDNRLKLYVYAVKNGLGTPAA